MLYINPLINLKKALFTEYRNLLQKDSKTDFDLFEEIRLEREIAFCLFSLHKLLQ
jgi:hypothetical protein